MRENNKKYNDTNEYDLDAKYYMHYAIGTRFENIVEINEDEYKELKQKLRNSKKAMVKVFAIYTVGFFQNENTYVLERVNRDVYYCLRNTQRYERNHRRHEIERHIHIGFNSDNIDTIPSQSTTEDEALKNIAETEVKLFLRTNLTQKQCDRFYRNIIEEIPIVVISLDENTHPSSVRESIEVGKKIIRKKLNEKNKKI